MKKFIKCLKILFTSFVILIGLYPTYAKYFSNKEGTIGDIEFNYFYIKLETVNENHDAVSKNIISGLNGENSKDSGDKLIATINARISNYSWDKDTFGSIASLGGSDTQSMYCYDSEGNVLSNMNFVIQFIPISGTSNNNINGVDYFYVYLYEGNIGEAGAASGLTRTVAGYHTYIINMKESTDTDGNISLIVDPQQYKTGYSSKSDLVGNSTYVNTDSASRNVNTGIDVNMAVDEYHWIPNVSRTKVIRDSNNNWVIDESIMGHAQADWYDENQTGENIHLSQRPSWEPASWHSGTIDNCSVVSGEHSVERYVG